MFTAQQFGIARTAIRTAREHGWTGSVHPKGGAPYVRQGDEPNAFATYGKFGHGRFEGEAWYAPYYMTAVLEGAADEPLYDGDDVAGDLVLVTDTERDVFGLPVDTSFVVLWYSPQGFVSLSTVTARGYDLLRDQYDMGE